MLALCGCRGLVLGNGARCGGVGLVWGWAAACVQGGVWVCAFPCVYHDGLTAEASTRK